MTRSRVRSSPALERFFGLLKTSDVLIPEATKDEIAEVARMPARLCPGVSGRVLDLFAGLFRPGGGYANRTKDFPGVGACPVQRERR